MIAELEGAFRARLLADVTLTGLLGSSTSVHNLIAPELTAFPYIVYEIVTAETEDHFRTAREQCDWRVSWIVEERPNAGTPDPVARGKAIELRVYGDWTAQAGGTSPTFGLHRWQPSLGASGWTASIAEKKRTVTAHAPGTLRWVMEGQVAIHKAGT